MILIIDEEVRRISIIKDYLEEFKYSSLLIGDIDKADRFISEKYQEIDAIILDVMMPWGNVFSKDQTENGILTGYEFYKKIRKDHGYETPIIIYTALNRDDLLNRLKKQKNCAVIHKTDPVSKILEKLRKFKVFPSKKIPNTQKI
jgi:CheY-like chemotaxis protein